MHEPENPGRSQSGPGTLYVIATPIGNMEDISERARRIFGEVDWVACEDTRRTGLLLERLGLRCRLISLWQGNEAMRSPQLLERLVQGEQGAVVSDGGTPLISDPGFPLVRDARAAGVTIVPVPGPSAVIAALSASGLPPSPFFFLGFPPRSPGRLRRRLAGLRDLDATLVLYESPERALATLRLAREVLGDREAVIARELTKLHEEFRCGRLGELAEQVEQQPLRGEVTLLIAGVADAGATDEAEEEAEPGAPSPLETAVAAALARGLRPRDAAREVATQLGVSRREAYTAALRLEQAGKEEETDEEEDEEER